MRCTNIYRCTKTARATARNFNRYHLPRASDVAVWKQSGDILPALSETDPPKGMAEVVMIPIVPPRLTPSPMPPATVSVICPFVQKIFVRYYNEH